MIAGTLGLLMGSLGGTVVAGGAAGPSTASVVAVGSSPRPPASAVSIGALPSAQRMHLEVFLPPRDPAALDSFLADLYDPASPDYHRFLPKGAFGPRFGAAPATIAAVDAALKSLGLSPKPADPDGLAVPVTTTAAAAEAAFGVHLEQYRLASGRVAFASTTAPWVPASIAPDLVAIVGLSNLVRPQPRGLARRSDARHSKVSGAETTAPVPVTPDVSGPKACATASATGGNTATKLARAYGFDQGAYANGDLGAGETVALVEYNAGVTMRQVSKYEACYGISTTVNVIPVDGASVTGTSGESAADVETVAGLAPDATVDAYITKGNDSTGIADYQAIADADSAQVVSTSWGFELCTSILKGTAGAETQYQSTYEPVFEQIAAQGQSLVSAAGDTGSEGCAFHDTTPTTTEPLTNSPNEKLLFVDPSTSPDVTIVGGTLLKTSSTTPPTESVWNSTPTAFGGGGGISSYWPMPAWQKPLGIYATSSGAPCGLPSGTYCREAPDVSADALGYPVRLDGDWTFASGTSLSTPLWAALTALADEACGPDARAGLLNPALYAHPGDFNDITVGTNDVTGENPGKYDARVGYDMASGLGTPTAALFSPGVLCQPTPTHLAFSTEPPTTTPADSSFSLSVSVEGATNAVSGTNTSTVSLSITAGSGAPGATLDCTGGDTQAATNGVATFSCSVDDPGATYTLSATDGTLTAATSAPFAVTGTSPEITSASTAYFKTGRSNAFTVTTTGAPTAALTRSGTLPKGLTFATNGNGTATISGKPGASATGTYEVTLSATNGIAPQGSQDLTIAVGSPPAFTTPASATFTVGQPGAFVVKTSGYPLATLAETKGKLPKWLTVTTTGGGTATISGKPWAKAVGTHTFTITATNPYGTRTQRFTLTVDA